MARRPIIDIDEARTAARAKASDPTNAESGSNEDTGFESITIEPTGFAPDTETAEIKLYNVDSGGSHDDEPVEFDLPAGINDDAISGPAAQAAALNADLVNLRKDEDDVKSDDAFGPDDSLTREQFAKMADLAYDLDDADSGSSFPDSDEIPSWIEDDIFSAPAAATKVDIARLRKDEDGEQDGIPAKGGNEGPDELENIRAAQLDDTIQEEHGRTLDDTLGQILDTSTQQGGATAQTGADVKPALGGEQLAGLTEFDEAEDLNHDVISET